MTDTAKLKAATLYQSKFSRLWERYDEASHDNAEHMRNILERTLEALKAAEKRIDELEVRKLELIIPPRRCHDYAAVAVQQRDEQWYKALHDACGRSGINLETGGE